MCNHLNHLHCEIHSLQTLLPAALSWFSHTVGPVSSLFSLTAGVLATLKSKCCTTQTCRKETGGDQPQARASTSPSYAAFPAAEPMAAMALSRKAQRLPRNSEMAPGCLLQIAATACLLEDLAQRQQQGCGFHRHLGLVIAANPESFVFCPTCW
jgi:hypothetical protein